jgi:archaellum component FlaG (FlaF/FlaG flagellin family)
MEERGQGGAEYLLIFGGIIVIAIAAIMLYSSYFGTMTNGTADVTLRIQNSDKEDCKVSYTLYDMSSGSPVKKGEGNPAIKKSSTKDFTIGNLPRNKNYRLDFSVTEKDRSASVTVLVDKNVLTGQTVKYPNTATLSFTIPSSSGSTGGIKYNEDAGSVRK